jgi:hypothetical protein
MAGVDVAAKIAKGLAKANEKLGKGELVYLVRETQTGGTPINPPTITTEEILLKDAIFKTININQMTNTLIQEGDRQLVSNSGVVIEVNDKIQQGARKMTVVSTDVAEPAGVVLVYKCVVRDL